MERKKRKKERQEEGWKVVVRPFSESRERSAYREREKDTERERERKASTEVVYKRDR